MSSERVYQVLARRLLEVAPRAVFGLMGEDTAALVTELGESGVTYYNARHEAIGVAMADGYAWATGEIGLAAISRGPGLTNALTAIRTAVRGRRRILLVAGAASKRGHSPDTKDVDQAVVAAAVGLAFFHVTDPNDAEWALEAAIASADAGEPALLAVAADVLNGPAGAAPRRDPLPPHAVPAGVGRSPSRSEVETVVELLSGSERPLIVAGRGADGTVMRELLEALAERTGALLGTTLAAKGLFRDSRYDLGVVGGFASDPAAPIFAELDCVLAFGASLNTFTTQRGQLFGHAPVVHVDVDPARLGAHHPVQLAIAADAELTAKALLDALPEPSATRALPLHEAASLARLAAPLYAGGDLGTADTVDPRMAAVVLDEVLPPGRTVVLDSGAFAAYPGKYVRVGPHGFRATTDFGSIGQGLGTALGVAVDRPDAPVVLFAGDGGTLLTFGDLDTAVRYRLPLVVVVMNDHAFGAEKELLKLMGVRDDYAIFADTDIAAAARGFGLDARTIRTLDELRALRDTFASLSGPLLLDCKLNPDVPAEWLRS